MEFENTLNLFFDETFQKRGIDMMGAISIPELVYRSTVIFDLNEKIKKDELSLHWADYSGGYEYKNDILSTLIPISHFFELNSINIIFKDNQNKTDYTNNEIEEMMYFKFPERIFYGLLRDYNSRIKLTPKIFVENATEYHSPKINLKENTVKNLNMLARYRGKNFQIKEDDFRFIDASKKRNNSEKEKLGQREIGVYIIDLLLGVVRIIIENNCGEGISNKKKEKNDLTLELLSHSDFYDMIEGIKIFYWTGDQKLERVSMSDYLKLFLSSHQSWIDDIISIKDEKSK